MGRRLSVIEFGGGNSTFFFLSRGLRVITIESGEDYINFICNVARETGFRAEVFSNPENLASNFKNYDLLILPASNFSEISSIMSLIKADIIVNDGISRREVLESIISGQPDAIVVLDNVEYAANWGRLDRSSAKPDLIKIYREFLRSSNWKSYVFEQSEGREGRAVADKTGWECPHRCLCAIGWPQTHLLGSLIMTNIGFPVVNATGRHDEDLQTLPERCPFDWDNMKWMKPAFPEELDLKLERDFD
jgi:hypothetical protein